MELLGEFVVLVHRVEKSAVVRTRDRHVQDAVFAQGIEFLSDTEEVRTGQDRWAFQ